MEKYLLEKAEGIMRELDDEVHNYDGEYKLLTHYGNIESLLGKWYVILEILDDLTTEKSEDYPEWCKLHDKYEPFIQETFKYIETFYGKLKED